MIELENVTMTYPGGMTALKNVNINIEKGEFVFIVGSSGSGKKIEISSGMTADKTVNMCCKALKITETLQVMERQGYFYEGKISCYGNVLLRMLFACGKGSQ